MGGKELLEGMALCLFLCRVINAKGALQAVKSVQLMSMIVLSNFSAALEDMKAVGLLEDGTVE